MSKPKLNEDAFKKVINGILESAKVEMKKKQGEVIEVLKEMGMEDFDLYIRYPLEQCVGCMHEDSNAEFIYAHYGYVENAFSRLISDREGGACSVDKSTHITRRLYSHFNEGKEFDVASQGPDEKCTIDGKEYGVYWKPYTLTNEQCLEFFNAIQIAYYGNHVKLFEFYKNLMEKKDA